LLRVLTNLMVFFVENMPTYGGYSKMPQDQCLSCEYEYRSMLQWSPVRANCSSGIVFPLVTLNWNRAVGSLFVS